MPTLAEEMRAIAETTGKVSKERSENAYKERLSNGAAADIEEYVELFIADAKSIAPYGERFISFLGTDGIKQLADRLKSHGFNIEDKTGLFIVTC